MTAKLSARTWKDATGREVEADYVSHDDTNLTMRLKNGHVVKYPIEKLSDESRNYLEELESREEVGSGGVPGEADEEQGELNWDDSWPDKVVLKGDPRIEVVEEDEDGKKFVYESENYRFTCDVKLTKSVVESFVGMFETTRLFARAMPLAFDGGEKIDGKYGIVLCESEESYVKMGARPGTAGGYAQHLKLVVIPLTSLAVRKTNSGYTHDRNRSNGLLIHELIHQLAPREYSSAGANGWFSEGIADYCSVTPYRDGQFDVRGNLDEIEGYVTGRRKVGRKGCQLGDEFDAPDLKTFMLMDYSDFSGGNWQLHYGLGLLITTYFLHMDGEGDAARMKAFLKKLRSIGCSGNTAAALDALLDGRSWDELEEDIQKAWRKEGVKIHFK